MGFIRLYPLKELVSVEAEVFGRGEPARCRAEAGMGASEFFLALTQIAAFEECPLYLVSAEENNTLIDGIRIRLVDGSMIVIADDAADEDERFQGQIQIASREGVAYMSPSTVTRAIARKS